jgi:hypothetical protein
VSPVAATPRQRRGSLLQHFQERRPVVRRQLAKRLYRRLSVLVSRHSVRHITISFQNFLIRVALGRTSLFISINEIPVFFLALCAAKQLVKDTHTKFSYAQE